MSRARDLSKLGDTSAFAVEADGNTTEVGISSASPRSTLDIRGEVQVGTTIQAGVAGVVTAASFSGDGSNITGVAGIGTLNVRTESVTVSGVSTLTGAVNVDATTDSTSTTTGALIVDGGAAIAKNVYIGAGLSVAGTLTYEDVTNVDSVGLITAKSGVNVSGGQLVVGVAYSVGAAGVATAAGFVGPLTGDVTGAVTGNADTATTATNQSGGSVTATTGSFSSNLTVGSGITMGSAGVATFSGTADVHLLDSVRLNVGDGSDLAIYHDGTNSFIKDTAGAAFNILATESIAIKTNDSEFAIACNKNNSVELYFNNSKKFETTTTGVSIAGTTISNGGDFISYDNGHLKLGTNSDLDLFHSGTDSFIRNSINNLNINAGNSAGNVYINLNENVAGVTSERAASFNKNSSVDLYYDNNKKFETTFDGVVVTGIVTTSAGVAYTGLLREAFAKTDGKLSDNTNIDLEDGMVHYFTTTESTTSTPNLRWNSSFSLNNKMNINDTITVTIITSAAAAGYSAQLTIDGGSQTEQWVGGSAPSEGGSDGYDIYTYNILKTASATFLVIGNLVNAT